MKPKKDGLYASLIRDQKRVPITDPKKFYVVKNNQVTYITLNQFKKLKEKK